MLNILSKTSVPPGRSQTSSASIPPGSALDVANSEFPSVACGGLGSPAAVGIKGGCSVSTAAANSVRRPAKQTAAVVGVQPPSDAAAVDHFSSAFIGA